MTRYTFTNNSFQVHSEDNGAALIGEIEGPGEHIFVRIQSWDRSRGHDEIKKLWGKKVRVIVETVEDDNANP